MDNMLDNHNFITWAVVVAFAVLVLFVVLMLLVKFYRKVDQGSALIVNTMKAEPVVTFTGRVVVPVIHRAEVMDISVKTIDLDRRGKEGLICKDNIRADIKVAFFVRVNKTTEDVLKVAQAIGCARASAPDTLEALFVPKFSEALKTVGKRLEFEELYTKRDDFRDQIIEVIGKDLNGYVLEDAAIDYLEQTPVESMDPQNILDAQGIRKITMITGEHDVQTNFLNQEYRKAKKKQDVEAEEAILELERQKADAVAKQKREIETMQAREAAETAKVRSEEHQKAELARLRQEEEVEVQAQNKARQVEVAEKARQRAVAIETERVEKDRALEQISREREVELQRIDKEKALEVERKAIADVIAGRISIEKNVAEEEERIKDLRVLAEAKRLKDAKIIGAEGEAQEKLVLSIKEAEAKEQVAKHTATERLTLAEADLETSDRTARAKMRLAEGTQAEAAAVGLGEVKVREAEAIAVEKMGVAEARAQLERLEAEAKGVEATGLAHAKIKEADAAATEKLGTAEAVSIREKIKAEADGLAEKAKSMAAMEGAAKEHEEFRLKLEKETEVQLEGIRVRRDIALQQAEVLASALSSAKINLVGGDGKFLDQFFKAVSVGQATDAAIDHSQTAQRLFRDYLEGDASLREDVTQMLGGLDSESLKNLSLAAFLRKLSGKLDGARQNQLNHLIEQAEKSGWS